MEFLRFKNAYDFYRLFQKEEACIEALECHRWQGTVVSPFDPASKVYKCSNNRYRCKNTKKYFNVRTGTALEGSKIPLRDWFFAMYEVLSNGKGISSHSLAKKLSVTQKTAWFMLVRIRMMFKNDNQMHALTGVVEADETYVGGKEKNKHKLKKVGNTQGRSIKQKTPVFGLVQRGGKLIAMVVPSTQAEIIQPIIRKVVEDGTKFMSDEWWAYSGLSKFYDHKIVQHKARQYVNDDCYTNTLEGFWSLLKRGIFGIFHQVSRQHLQRYVDESVFRYNSKHLDNSEKFSKLLSMYFEGTRIRYKDFKKSQDVRAA